jgi:hypothetical protein
VDERAILDQVNKAWNYCEKCPKYVGAVTVETIRQALQNVGIPVSARDVFIHGIPIEFDLIVPRRGAPDPVDGILYKPEDVVAVLEVKASGLFGYNLRERIEYCHAKVREKNPNIFCGYVALSERQTFQEKNFGKDIPEWVFTLFWYRQEKRQDKYDPTGNWQKLLSEIQKALNR